MKKRALDNLRPEVRRFFTENGTYTEISAKLGISISNLSTQKSRGYFTTKIARYIDFMWNGDYKSKLLAKKGSIK